MENTLIYTSVGKNPDYLKFLDYFVKSLVYTNRSNINILIISDISFHSYVESVLKQYTLNWFILDVKDSITIMDTVTNRLRVFDFPKIYRFPFILYVDLDCLFVGDLSPILKNKIEHNKLYVYSENPQFKDLWMHPYILTREDDRKTGYYNAEQYNFLERKGKIPLNSGLFLFRTSDIMETHFRYLLDFIPNYKGGYWTDQTFLNVYFHLNNVSNFTIFNNDNIVMLASQKLDDVKPSHMLVHFNIPHPVFGQLNNKLEIIEEYWNKFRKEHKPVLLQYDTIAHLIKDIVPSNSDIHIAGTLHKETIEALLDKNPKRLHLVNGKESIVVVKKRYEFYPNVNIMECCPIDIINKLNDYSTDVVFLNKDDIKFCEYSNDICNKVRKGGLVIGNIEKEEEVSDIIDCCKKYGMSIIGFSKSENLYYAMYKHV